MSDREESEIINYDTASAEEVSYDDEIVVEEIPEPESLHYYFIATVKIIFIREGRPRERTVNVLMDLLVPFITQNTLNDMNRIAAGKVVREGNVDENDIKEAITMSISPLGHMPPSTFRDMKLDTKVHRVNPETGETIQ